MKILIICGGAGRGLLSQREALGFNAELQLDVSKELVPRGTDSNAWRIALDPMIGTTYHLLEYVGKRWGKEEKSHGNHAKLLEEKYPVSQSLDRGLQQCPAIGGAVIRHEDNEERIRQAVLEMIGRLGHNLGPNNPLVVWIISSTAGGTGAGIRRHVASLIANIMHDLQGNANVEFHFLSYGSRTYSGVDKERTELNTFMCVAADSAFERYLRKINERAVAFFYYLEIPDVGTGDKAIPLRERVVEVTAKALLLDEVSNALQRFANNVPNKMVFARAGFWGAEFNEEQLYYETLKQLTRQLRDLTTPTPEKFIKGYEIKFEQSTELREAIEAISTDQLIQNSQWEFPHWPWLRYRIGRSQKTRYEIEQNFIRESIESLNELLELSIEKHTGRFSAEKIRETESSIGIEGEFSQAERILLEVIEPDTAGELPWKEKQNYIEIYQRVRIWCENYLGDKRNPGLERELLEQAKRCADKQHQFLSSSAKKRSELVPELRKFLELAVQVNRLKVLREQSRRKLDEYLIPVREVQGFAEDELNKLESTRMVTSSQDLILANNLSDPVDGYSHRTWFDLLEQAMEMKSVLQFRRAVLEGAKGLGSVGLAQILTPNKNYSTEAIRDEVLSRAGRYYLDGNESEGNWWQAVDNIWDKAEDKFRFRIFPWLEDTLWKSLGFENLDKKEFEALRTKIGALGLRVLAVDIANIGKKNIVKAPQELLDPLKSIIKKQFKIWDLGANPGDFTGKLNVVLAGVGGESMARDPLLAIGLDEKEIGELMNYYDLINLA